MNLFRAQTMTDTIHDSIEYSGIEGEILGTPIFNRLHRVTQSSLAFQTYSSNKTKRFEHSVGVMDLAGRMFFHSVCNTEKPILQLFLDDIKSAIIEWRKQITNDHLSSVIPRNVISLYSDDKILDMPLPSSSFYYRYFPNIISELDNSDKVAYYVAFQAVRIAGLLHDVGHMPYSHIMENAIKKLFTKVKLIPVNERTENQQMFIDSLSTYCDPSYEDADEIHEEIGKICANKIFECIANITERSKSNIFFIATYDFACTILQSKTSQNNIYSDLHRLVAGVVDADRLDYCSRDAITSGLRKDIINYKRLLLTYSICKMEPEKPLMKRTRGKKSTAKTDVMRQRFYFCPDVKNVPLVEDLLYRRWDIFFHINYHHRVQKHEILFEEVIVDLGYEELEDERPIMELRQGVLPLKIYSIWKLIGLLKGNDPPEYLLAQFDDSWLDTLLKRRFFERYKDQFMWSPDHASDPKWNRYDELISLQKHYYSVFKRAEDFRKLDNLLFCKVMEHINTIGDTKKFDILKGTSDYNSFLTQYRSLFFPWMLCKVAILPEERAELFIEIESVLKKFLAKEAKIQDVIVRDCTFKLGCASAKNKLMISDHGTPKPFQNYSTIEQILQEKRNLSLPLHLYFLPAHSSGEYPTDNSKIALEKDVYPQLVNAIWITICNRMNIVLKEELV